MNRDRSIRIFALALAALVPHFGIAAEPAAASTPVRIVPPPPALSIPQPIDDFLKFEATEQQVTVPHGTVDTLFTFSMTNISAGNVTIHGVHTSCGCTVPKLPQIPWTLAPGTNGQFQVTMNIANKMGTVTKTVTVNSDKGAKMLFVRANILPPAAGQMAANERTANQQIALADRQAVFRGDCASCHADTKDKMGKELFASVCGVCHEAEHRASMVPDLRALTQPTNAEYWRNWIVKGKPGTLMPAFSEKEGGILNDAQIESLVKYLTDAIPSKGSTQAPAAQPQPGKGLSQLR